ncbi:MAG TPA: class III cytochrome C [Desulfobulbus sp.]|nr:class III cytochrome C [Desulfobulbus sp.]
MRFERKLLPAVRAMGLGLLLLIPAGGLAMDVDDAPAAVVIDFLQNLYEPVHFDHTMHLDMATCSHCHHHTIGTGPANPLCARCHAGAGEGDIVACSDCHDAQPFTVENLKKTAEPKLFHIDKPGLMAAFHINCRGCHEEAGGPTGCQDCHKMTEAGEKRFNTGKYAPSGYKAVPKHHDAEKKHE